MLNVGVWKFLKRNRNVQVIQNVHLIKSALLNAAVIHAHLVTYVAGMQDVRQLITDHHAVVCLDTLEIHSGNANQLDARVTMTVHLIKLAMSVSVSIPVTSRIVATQLLIANRLITRHNVTVQVA